MSRWNDCAASPRRLSRGGWIRTGAEALDYLERRAPYVRRGAGAFRRTGAPGLLAVASRSSQLLLASGPCTHASGSDPKLQGAPPDPG
jgi:hypothetical protein